MISCISGEKKLGESYQGNTKNRCDAKTRNRNQNDSTNITKILKDTIILPNFTQMKELLFPNNGINALLNN